MEGYIHGSNMIVFVGSKALGHCSTCEIQDTAETKSRAIKALPDYNASSQQSDTDLQPSSGEDTTKDGLWEEKSVSKRTVAISAEGFICEGESGEGYEDLLAKMDAGEPVKVKYAHKGEESTKYRVGMFLITSLKRNDPANDDSTYSISLENTGKVRTKVIQ